TWLKRMSTRSRGVSPGGATRPSRMSSFSLSCSSAAMRISSLLAKRLYTVPSATLAEAATSRKRTAAKPSRSARATAVSTILFARSSNAIMVRSQTAPENRLWYLDHCGDGSSPAARSFGCGGARLVKLRVPPTQLADVAIAVGEGRPLSVDLVLPELDVFLEADEQVLLVALAEPLAPLLDVRQVEHGAEAQVQALLVDRRVRQQEHVRQIALHLG